MDYQPNFQGGQDADGAYRCDRDEFVRIWQRVSPEPKPDTPISVYIGDEAEQTPAKDEFLYVEPRRDLPAVLSSAPAKMGAVPRQDEPHCFGHAAADYAPILQNMVLSELANMRVYQALRRNAGDKRSRRLADLADDGMKHAKKLSTAYFLLSGMTYWPVGQMPHPALKDGDLAALRGCYLRAQKSKAQCLTIAEHCSDNCLSALCRDMAAEQQQHLHHLHSVMEQMLA